MSLRYLTEHAENALLALELTRKETAHLQYTHRTLFAQSIDANSRLCSNQKHLTQEPTQTVQPHIAQATLPLSAYAAPSRSTRLF